jgi:hypothetical protein
MPAPRSPTARTKSRLSDNGWTFDETQRQIAKWMRRDFCGLFDMIAFKRGRGVLGVQICALPDLASHVDKWKMSPHLLEWLLAVPGLTEASIHAWKTRGKWSYELRILRAVVRKSEAGIPFVDLEETHRE